MNLNLEIKTKSDEIIKAYLEENASEILADKINNGVFIEKDGKRLLNRKSLSSFMQYATEEARKLAEQGAKSACIEDSVVFGWAIHYFEEDSIEGTLFNEDGSEYKNTVTTPKTSGKSTYTPTSAPIIKKQEPQLSLFDMMNGNAQTDEQTDNSGEDYDENPTDEELDEAFAQTAIETPETKKTEDKPQPKGTPFYEKYKELALKYSDGIVCYRLGDFYEVLGKKAVVVADELELTMTGRDCGLESRVPIVGFPYHCADMYFSKLIDKGHKVVIVESLDDVKILSHEQEDTSQVVDTETGEILSDNEPTDLKNYHKGALLMLLELFDGEATIG